MAFLSGIVSEDWRTAVTVPVYKGKGERTVRTIRVVVKTYSGEGEARYW